MDSWSQPSDPRWWTSLLATFLLSALLVWLSIHYANRRNLVDHPGMRRSHTIVTARGGGIGIVIAVMAMGWAPMIFFPRTWPLDVSAGVAGALCLALVAGVGWIDDHRPLSARTRILVHFSAALLFLFWPLLISTIFEQGYALSIRYSSGQLAVAVSILMLSSVAVVWSINLHNFMDGINGLLACQAVFVFAALGALSVSVDAELARLFLLFACAVLGFLPFNFPRARIFMGDVGSGALGFLIAICILSVLKDGWLLALSGLILCSAFVTDATCTLLSRMLRGRRWYSAHREHLYQWLARSGFSHAGVVALYMGWNFLVVVPVLYLASRGFNARVADAKGATAASGLGLALMTYALAIAIWILGKRWCLAYAKKATM